MLIKGLDPSNMVYRKDIDGLRAVAVILVILYHLETAVLTGGYIGVDVFFVISGYLISQRIIYSVLADKFSFRDFYTRRIRRIFPALFSTTLLTLAVGHFLLSPDILVNLSATVISTVLSVANIHFYLESGYWDASIWSKPLLHMWSLGVEEQFYFIWPLFLVLIFKYFRASLLNILLVLAFISIILTAVVTNVDKSAAFYLTPFRAYEFLFGALCVWFDGFKWEKVRFANYVKIVIFVTGLFLILGSSIIFTDETAFPGYWAVVPALGASLIIIARGPPFFGFILTNSVSRYLGLISYSLYLIHWPVLLYMREITNELTMPLTLLALAIIFALSIAQYYLIGSPPTSRTLS